MKKIVICTLLIFIISIATSLSSCNNKNELTKVKLCEVVHSIFYAPQYVALEKGFFKEEGLEIDLTTGQGADKTMTAVLSNNADIGLMGPEASIYVYNEGKEDFAINFAQLTQRAGNFLIAREPIENFSWDMLNDKTVIGGRPGGMPEMVLEYILKQRGIEPFVDTEIITNLDFTATAGAFTGGTGDFTVEFEPTASTLELQGDYYIVASLGIESGKIPYTAYMAKSSYIEENPEIIQKFTNAIYKAQLWVSSHTAEEIAEIIKPYFSETDITLITTIIERYKEQDTWKETPYFDEESLVLLQDILDFAGELSKQVSYDEIVNTDFAVKSQEIIK